MKKISRAIAKSRILILIVAIILLIPSAIGYFNTKVNYDILSYLPDDLETREAQKIMKDEFDCGSLAMLIVEGMENKDVAKLKEKVSNVDGVSDVIWIDDALDISVPKEILPSLVRDMLFSDDSTLMIVKLKDTDASESTEKAIKEIPTIRMLTYKISELEEKAKCLYDKIIDKNIDADVFIEDGLSQVGGGSMPLETIKTKVVAITPKNMSVSSLEKKLRLSNSHIIARIYDNKYILDVRTIFEEEFEIIANELKKVLN